MDFSQSIIPGSGKKVNEKMDNFRFGVENYRRNRKKEVKAMNCNANKCIECTVQQCAYHCSDANYCSLDRILVGTHEANPTADQCTDCKSFRKK